MDDPTFEAGFSTLQKICASGHYVKALENLAQNDADFNVVDEKGRNLLHYALKNFECPEIMEWLLENDLIDVNAQDNEGNTALSSTPENSPCLNLLALLRFGADVNILNRNGEPLKWSCCTCPEVDYTCPGYVYLKKLEIIGYKINPTTKSYFPYLYNDDLYNSEMILYKKELEDLKKIYISNFPKKSLYDVLFMDRKTMATYVDNCNFKELYYEKHKGDFSMRYPYYGDTLNLKFRRGLKRKNIQNSCRQSLSMLIGTDILNTYCYEEILKYFNQKELDRFRLIENFIVKKKN